MDYENEIFLGNCIEILKTLPENSISACLTDPPYNYEFIGHNWNYEEIQRRTARVQNKVNKTLVKNIPYGSGLAGGVRNKGWYEKNRQNVVAYENWCHEWGNEVFRVCKPGALIAVFNSTRTFAHVQVALEKSGFYARDCLVYRRHSGIPKGLNIRAKLQDKGIGDYEKWEGWHSCLRGEWEAVAVLQKPLVNNYVETVMQYGVGLFNTSTEDGSFQSNILEGIEKDRKGSGDFNVHCTVKPLELMKRLIKIMVPPSDNSIVLDPFAGSGTTLVAAKELGTKFVGIEIVPEYVNVIRQRLEKAEIKEASKAEKGLEKRANEQSQMPGLFE